MLVDDDVDRPEPDNDHAFALLRERLDAGEPILLSTDTYYLGYHNTSSHFPGHRCVAVGYDDETETVLIADRKFEEYQRCSFQELRESRNATDYPMKCNNQWGDFGANAKLGRPLEEAIAIALRRNAEVVGIGAEENRLARLEPFLEQRPGAVVVRLGAPTR